MELGQVASQPDSARRSIDEFVWSLAEAVITVLVVCFFLAGPAHRAGGGAVDPLVLAVTFGMRMFDVGLHKISLRWILALGLFGTTRSSPSR